MSKVAKLIKFPKDLVEEIEAYRNEHYVSSFTGTVIELIRMGLTCNKKL